MVWQLRELAALPEDLGSVPSTFVWRLLTTCDSRFRKLIPFSGLWGHLHSQAYNDTQIQHTHTQKKNMHAQINIILKWDVQSLHGERSTHYLVAPKGTLANRNMGHFLLTLSLPPALCPNCYFFLLLTRLSKSYLELCSCVFWFVIPLLMCVYVRILAYVWHTHPPTHIYIWGQKQLKDKRNYFSVLFQVIAHHRGKARQDRNWRQELRPRLQKNAGL